MIDFKIRRGLSSELFISPGVVNPNLVIEEGHWYLCTDTADLFLGIRVDEVLSLKRINGSSINEFNGDIQAEFNAIKTELSLLKTDYTNIPNLIKQTVDSAITKQSENDAFIYATQVALSATNGEIALIKESLMHNYYSKEELYDRNAIDALLAGITVGNGGGTEAIAAELDKFKNESTQNFKTLNSWIEAHDSEILPIVIANKNSLDALTGVGEGSIQQIVSETFKTISVASTENLGLVKASDELGVDSEGKLKINCISTDKLVQGEQPLVLYSGGAADILDSY